MLRTIFILAIVRPTHFLIFPGLCFKTHYNGVLCSLGMLLLTLRSGVKFNVITLIMPQNLYQTNVKSDILENNTFTLHVTLIPHPGFPSATSSKPQACNS